MYHKNNLIVKILFENLFSKTIEGIKRPQVYLDKNLNYCSNCKFDLLNEEIKQKEVKVITTVIESPRGFKEHLQIGSVLLIKDGIQLLGKAIILEIIGNVN